MSRNATLAHALRVTAHRLADPATRYQWTHQGSCNCGHLAQTLVHLDAAAIHAAGLEAPGDWSAHARHHAARAPDPEADYCPSTGLALEHILATMYDAGVTPEDLVHLEWLSDPRTVARVGRHLDHRRREDVVDYLVAWADRCEGR